MIGQSMKCRLGSILARSSNFCSISSVSSSRYSIYSHSIASASSYIPPISLKSSNNYSSSDNSICSSNIKYSSSNSNSSNSSTSSIQSRSFHSTSINRGIEEFYEKKVQAGESVVIGRPWTAADLRRKSFEDLHKLWFVLYKERNMLLSEREKRRKTMKASSLFDERRYIGVKRSMAAIKFVLAERRDIEKIIKAEELVAEREKIAVINRAKLAATNPAVDNAATAASPNK